MIPTFLRRDGARRRTIEALHQRVNASARDPGLYANLGVPDTVEGRFEALCLHVVLVLRCLRALPAPAPDVAQDLVDSVFLQLDAALRELGVGDFGVPKRMKKLGKAFYGRAERYAAALDAGDGDALAAALARNVMGTEDASAAAALADYVRACDAALAEAALDAILADGPRLPAPAAFAPREHAA